MFRQRVLLLGLVVTCAVGCSRMGANRDVIHQVSTIYALLEGVYDGEVTCGELKRHGDIGIGAFNALDGEMVLLDGTFYQIKADGSVTAVESGQKTPFAVVTSFETDRVVNIAQETDFEQFKKTLDAQLGKPNLPFAFRIEGTFSYVKTRSVPRQHKPYPRLVEVTKTQPEFEFENVSGEIVGFRLPACLEGVNVPGYHFHFLTADRKGGGHLLAFRARTLRAACDLCSGLFVVLPKSEVFADLDLTARSREDLEQVMKGTRRK